MKLWLSPYQLKAHTGEIRRGYLLKTQASGQAAGYADIFPWPEFGDPEFSDIPFLIKQGRATPLIRRSLTYSRRDALERTEKNSLLAGKTTSNHFLVLNAPSQWMQDVEKALANGFRKVKIKVGRRPEEEIPALQSLLKFKSQEPWLRLDFNCKGTLDYFDRIKDLKDCVEFVEDPFADPEAWAAFNWPWAFDQPTFDDGQVRYSFRVIKPAKQLWEIDENHPLIFTSYMDHPVGIAHAMVEALESGRQLYDYGLMSQNRYQETPFHKYLKSAGPHLTVAGDYGIGFDDLFDDLQWVEV